MDNTNLVTWGATAKANYEKLTIVYLECEKWARENRAKFEPSKYQLIHFTRSRQHTCKDLVSTMRIGTY